ncbi:MAG: glycosyltransferase family 4 protein [Anaerolineales bacterium]|uniref:glycosyltransferase family 4 protein n=1 Tax=Candidatus Villigracilis vicinus TaxID=3140679 RepID=UPI0031370DB8|nr:glycosyltransferase family 4 protein [Anaerolineales bacterium]
MTKICITPFVQGTGGMASFRLKFEQGLRARGIDVTHDLDEKSDAVLVIAGTRFLLDLNRARRRGIRVVQRLDGVNWVQRVKWSGVKYSVRAEYGNVMLATIRNHFADRVIYQSQFIRKWWEDWYGVAKAPASVIINGVDLNAYTHKGEHERPTDKYRMLLLEGSLARGLNSGLFHAVSVAEKMSAQYPMEVVVAGVVDEATQQKLQSKVPVKFLGTVPRADIPKLARSSHFMYCAEVNPPCPNSVIEALACGLPVIGFDSGSLKELVTDDAGCIVPYGANPWKLETPDIDALASSAGEMLEKQSQFRAAARRRAESAFGLDGMVDEYLKVLLG